MKSFLIAFIFLFSGIISIAQDITGNWQGLIPAGGKNLRLIFHVTKSGETYSAKFDSPDQNAFGLSCSSVTVLNDSLLIGIELVKGGYKGKWNGKDMITGVYSQGPGSMAIDLKRVSDAELPKTPATQIKPQTPKPPFSYIIEEVGYENTVQKNHLAGTFTKPMNGNKFPVVLMITGSGPQDRDESIGMHKPFWVIADYLTKQGIAVLRVDDRGMGKSTGDFRGSTSADFATDVMAGINYLKTRSDIDTTKIGLIGHSEGGMIAPYVAARSKDVAFIVMLAGPAIGGIQTMYFQAVEKPMANLSAHDRNAYGQLYNKMLGRKLDDERGKLDVDQGKDITVYTRNAFMNWKKKQPDSTLKVLIHGTDEEVIKLMSDGFRDFERPWWRFFLTYDIAKDLQKLKIPVFALNGEKDEQVDSKANLAAIKTIFTKNKNTRYRTYEVPGVNHLFQHCKACGSVSEYLTLDETFDTATLTIIGNWIKEQVK